MSLSELFLLVVLWLHVLAATAWVGGSIFYLLALAPGLRMTPDVPSALSTIIGVEFRTVVVTSIMVLVATGAILAFDRLTEVEPPYAATLGVKVILSVWMFLLVRDREQHLRVLKAFQDPPTPPATTAGRLVAAVSGYNTLVVLGILVLLLSVAMDALFEIELRTE